MMMAPCSTAKSSSLSFANPSPIEGGDQAPRRSGLRSATELISSRGAAYARKIAPLALSYGVSRLSAFGLVVFIGRFLGASALGEFSLAHALGQYVMLGSDLGTKAIGARMIAADHSSAPAVLPQALRKMAMLVLVSASVVITYSLIGPVPAAWRWFLVAFALSTVPFAFNIDWLFLGLERFGVFAVWQGGVYTAYALLAIAFTLTAARRSLYGVAAGSVIAWIGGASFLWLRWRKSRRAPRLAGAAERRAATIRSDIAWRSIFSVGSIGVAAMVLDNASLLVLGAIGTPRQVGEYGAASKILAPILGLQTLVWWGVYPWLVRRQPLMHGQRFYAWLLPAIAGLAGLAMAVPLAMGAHAIVVLCFGVGYAGTAGPLRVLCLEIPFALATIASRAILVAHAHDLLASAGIVASAAAGLALSCLLVPRYGPAGAAWATTGAYVLSAFTGLGALSLVRAPLAAESSDGRMPG